MARLIRARSAAAFVAVPVIGFGGLAAVAVATLAFWYASSVAGLVGDTSWSFWMLAAPIVATLFAIGAVWWLVRPSAFASALPVTVLAIWFTLVVAGFAVGAWTSLIAASDLVRGSQPYPNEEMLRAVAGWGLLGVASLIAPVPAAAASLIRSPRLRWPLVIGLAIAAVLVLAVVGPMAIAIGTPGPGDPANL